MYKPYSFRREGLWFRVFLSYNDMPVCYTDVRKEAVDLVDQLNEAFNQGVEFLRNKQKAAS